MSQHSDLLSHSISKGLRNKWSAATILDDIGSLLLVLEYTDDWCEGPILKQHVISHAQWMRTQRENLYGVTYKQLDTFIRDLTSLDNGS
jgi:hypothetical protein